PGSVVRGGNGRPWPATESGILGLGGPQRCPPHNKLNYAAWAYADPSPLAARDKRPKSIMPGSGPLPWRRSVPSDPLATGITRAGAPASPVSGALAKGGFGLSGGER